MPKSKSTDHASQEKPAGKWKTLRVPAETYERLELLQIQYPGKSVAALADQALTESLEKRAAELAKLEELRRQHPDLSIEELADLVVKTGLAALTAPK